MSLVDTLLNAEKKALVIEDCCKLVDEEVASKTGLSGLAVKAGYKAVKGIKPGFIPQVVDKLLPEFAEKLDPIWNDGIKDGNPTSYLVSNRSRVAEALLAVTDGKINSSNSGLVRSTYKQLRGSAKKNVEDAVPRLSKVIQKHA